MSGKMVRGLTALVAAALLVAWTVAAAPARAVRQTGPGGGDGRVVVRLTAVDGEGRPVPELKPEDLRVTAGGSGQSLLDLSRATEEPLHVVVMLDASASQEHILPLARQAAAQFVTSLLRPGRDEAAVVSFTGEAEVVEGLTGDAEALRRAIASVEFVPPAGYVPGRLVTARQLPSKEAMRAARAAATAIWDSLVTVCEDVFGRAKPGRRAVVLVSDGVDTVSLAKSDRTVERLLRDGVAVYSVGVADTESFDGLDKDALRKVSERTGGRAHFPKKAEDLPQAFGLVRQELLSSYSAAFAPQALKGDGRLHKLRVEVVNPELRRRGVKLSYPQGFFLAAPEPARR